jgi:hypothetical protein
MSSPNVGRFARKLGATLVIRFVRGEVFLFFLGLPCRYNSEKVPFAQTQVARESRGGNGKAVN